MKPIRTCIGCRHEDARANLLRFVLRNGQVVPDREAQLSGRGAWLHPTPTCLEQAIARRAFGRAFRVSIDIYPTTLREQAERLMDK